jgi:hypothetical protein
MLRSFVLATVTLLVHVAPGLAQQADDSAGEAQKTGEPTIAAPQNAPQAAIAAGTGDASSTPQPLDPARLAIAEKLVQQLGSRRFAERDAAAAQLLDLGQEAIAALSAATSSNDAEVRARASSLLQQIVSSDFESRVAAFAAASSGEASFGLPGWSYVRERLPDEPVVRELFIGLCRSQPDFLHALEQPPSERQRAFDRLERQLSRGMLELREYPELHEVAGLLMLATDKDVKPSDTANGTITTLMQISPMNTIMSDQNLVGADARRRAVMADLAVGWLRNAVDRRRNAAIMMAIRWELTTAAELARVHLQNAGDDLDLVMSCCQAIARFGTIADADALAGLLDDRRVLEYDLPDRDQQIQVRDVAAASLLLLLGADLRESGFPQAQTHPLFAFIPETIALEAGNEERRQQVVQAARERLNQSRTEDEDLQPVR